MNPSDPAVSPLLQFLQDLDQRLSRMEQMIHSNARSIAANTQIIAELKLHQSQTETHIARLVESVLKLAEHLEADQDRRHRILDILLKQAEQENQVLDSLSRAQKRQAEILCHLVSIEREKKR
jgi:DNA-binding MarR family transcriptional regulator